VSLKPRDGRVGSDGRDLDPIAAGAKRLRPAGRTVPMPLAALKLGVDGACRRRCPAIVDGGRTAARAFASVGSPHPTHASGRVEGGSPAGRAHTLNPAGSARAADHRRRAPFGEPVARTGPSRAHRGLVRRRATVLAQLHGVVVDDVLVAASAPHQHDQQRPDHPPRIHAADRLSGEATRATMRNQLASRIQCNSCVTKCLTRITD